MANRERRRAILRGREYREHGGNYSRKASASVARGTWTSKSFGQRRGHGASPRRMAGGGGGMTPVLAVAPSVWWYLTRAGGAVSLLLLTATVVLGVVEVSR